MTSKIIPLISVVIPCFNEQEVIEITSQRLMATFEPLDAYRLQMVFVDDGSQDATRQMLAKMALDDARIKVVTFSRNFGHQEAVTAGLMHSDGDAAVVIDADLQDPPEVIPEMIEKWQQGYQVVYGVRRARKEGVLKRVAYFSFYRLLNTLSSIEIPMDSGDFALMDRSVLNVLKLLPEKNRFVRGLRAWAGFKQTGLPYERAAREAGESKYSFFKLVKLAFDGIFNFSTRPLRLILIFGLMLFFFAGGSAVWLLLRRVFDITLFGSSPSDVPGYASQMIVSLLFHGAQLIAIGVLGEYIGRIYQEVKQRPSYVIEQIVEKTSSQLEDKITR
ncbi:glycosyltransferase family 2 protein [Magnetococcus sp. PR-3]|uniref:glycosyltransferase family 2 protein n=1 Tax=Magnetococcus sp. PR-3 TaxID=3120355 RepID=UPI002FCE0120